MNETEYVTDVYNKIGGHFDVTRVNHWTWITDFISKLPNDSYILDNGCGNGRNMTYPNHRFKGIDSAKTFIDICIKKGLDCELGDICHLPFEDNTFDAILCIATFHHLSSPKRRLQTLNEMYRVLKPGGKVLLSVWSIIQPPKTRRVFKSFGDTIVPWMNSNKSEIYKRYYYIFELDEICYLFRNTGFKKTCHLWDTGNEIFELVK